MNLYYFMLKRWQHNYQQVKCIFVFFIVFLPLISFAVLIRPDSSIVFHSLLLFMGWCTWTFTEYILHRFWMHNKGSSSTMTRIHVHHHSHPTELVVTNFHRVTMVVVLAILIVVANNLDNYFTFFVGYCFGIEIYFLVHRLIHARMGQRLFQKLVLYHIYHHCRYTNTCFGVTVPWWDDLFRTVPQNPKITQSVIDFYFNDHHYKDDHHSLMISAGALKKAKTNDCNHDCRRCQAITGQANASMAS
jgi:hypothetical protein